MTISNRFFLAKSYRSWQPICLGQTAHKVIPLSCLFPPLIYLNTFLIEAIRFSFCPCRILSLQWSAINPVELSVILSVESNPHSPVLNCLLFHYQVTCEVILSFWSDYGEISSQILASRPSVAPIEGWSAGNVIAWIFIANPVLQTT